MMSRYFFLITIFFTFSLNAQIDKDEMDRLKVDALIVKDLKSDAMVYSKEAFKEVKPASLTKIMTAILALEQGYLYRPVVITSEMVRVEPTKAGYREGEMVILEDLVKAAMIESDNDAAMAIAVAVGGSVEKFVEMMNAKASLLGMNNTLFTNPCGYDIGNHHSTPIDLLRLAEYAIQNPRFNEITRMNRHEYAELISGRPFVAKTHNHLLNRYEYAVGVKTGYTSKAGPCLIARAQKDGKDCLIIMLNAKENRWSLARQIFEKLFVRPEDQPSDKV
ncbi:MAG: serine hydrolase [Campylobacterota bacterium]